MSFLYSSHRSEIVIKTMRPENKPKANKLSLGLARRRRDIEGKVETEEKWKHQQRKQEEKIRDWKVRPDGKIKKQNKKQTLRQRKKMRAEGLEYIQPDGSFWPCESHLLRDGLARWTGQKVWEREGESVMLFWPWRNQWCPLRIPHNTYPTALGSKRPG